MLSTLAPALSLFLFATSALALDVFPVGNLQDTQHQVQGTLYAFNQSTLILDNFSFDGDGFGVFFNIALEGRTRGDYRQNRLVIGWPTPFEAVPLERRFDQERLFIDLPQGIRVSDIKWFSVWCEVFGISFGEVDFPKGNQRLFANEA